MPRRVRRQVERLSHSKQVARLLKVLNGDESYRVPGWTRLVRRLEDDLRYLQDRCSRWNQGERLLDPPAAEDITQTIMGVQVPHPRVAPPFSINPADYGHNPKAIAAALECLGAISEFAESGRADLVHRCACERYNWRKKSCNALHRQWKSRPRKALSR